MLSKCKGLILRIAGVLHVLFGTESTDNLSTEISNKAIAAAQDFVDVCCKHAAFVAGRGDIHDAITHLQKGWLLKSDIKYKCVKCAYSITQFS